VAVPLPGTPLPGAAGLWLSGAAARNLWGMHSTSDTTPLAGRTAVVTGATSGIGAATARRLAADGAAVALAGRREARLRELAAEIDGAVPVTLDVADRDAVRAAADSIRAELGPVDLVVANAGVMLAAPFDEADPLEWDRMLDTNVRGLLAVGQAFAGDLIAAAEAGQRADLVHVGSIGGHTIYPTYAVYNATKAAVAHLTRNLRAELGPRGVRVKNVEPGLVATELGHDISSEAGLELLDDLKAQVPALDPVHIAASIAHAVAAPPAVNVANLVVLPTAQG
jgi:NADP-dependent 3-hydroxy acid dehydrogenase YdfG